MKRIICIIFGHQFFEIRRLGQFTHLMGCHRCDKIWGMNTDVRCLLPWNMELEDHHRFMGDLKEGETYARLQPRSK